MARPLRGHLNFFCTPPSTATPSDITKQEGANYAFPTAQHGSSVVTDSFASSSDAAPCSASEIPPTDELAQAWTGRDLTLSMQAALTDSSTRRGAESGLQAETPIATATASAGAAQVSACETAAATAAVVTSVAELKTASTDAAIALDQPASSLTCGTARHLEIKMVPATPELIPVEFPLYKKYQMTNHGDAPTKASHVLIRCC